MYSGQFIYACGDMPRDYDAEKSTSSLDATAFKSQSWSALMWTFEDWAAAAWPPWLKNGVNYASGWCYCV